MKKILMSSCALLLFSFAIVFFQISCKKDAQAQTSNPCPDPVYHLAGLWTGTYTVGPGNPVPAGTSFYFSFSIYSDGTLSYKSKGYHNGSFEYITFANGTWDLNGNAFSFSVQTINYPDGGPQHTQTGNATFESSTGTLSSGTITDPAGTPADWTMTRVN